MRKPRKFYIVVSKGETKHYAYNSLKDAKIWASSENQILEVQQTGSRKLKLALELFDKASGHPYECRCKACQYWWDLMPKEE